PGTHAGAAQAPGVRLRREPGLCRLRAVLDLPVGARHEPARAAGARRSAFRLARTRPRSLRRLRPQRGHRMTQNPKNQGQTTFFQTEKQRCKWPSNPLAIAYHDKEWGVPVRNDRKLFECLTLEGAQAGLSWDTILAKRDNYRRAF